MSGPNRGSERWGGTHEMTRGRGGQTRSWTGYVNPGHGVLGPGFDQNRVRDRNVEKRDKTGGTRFGDFLTKVGRDPMNT